MIEGACAECGTPFETRRKNRRFCSDKCRYRAKDRGRTIPCAACGEPILRDGKQKPGVTVHMKCKLGDDRHGTSTEYRQGCRCDRCREAHAERYLEWARRFNEENGYWRSSGWINREKRLDIYERDGFTCYLCETVLSIETPWNEPLALTLDHVQPKSKGGSDEPSNLKTCCRACNQAKGVQILM